MGSIKSRKITNLSVFFLVTIILFVTFVLQFYALGARTFHGDEQGSILEAFELGKNANSLPYFALLRLWLVGGNDEFWLRSLSAWSAIGAVAVAYIVARKITSVRIAVITALLLATSPFLVVYGQQIRFYTLALWIALFAIWAFVTLFSQASIRQWILWLVVGLGAVATLFLNGLLILGQIITLFALTKQFTRRAKWVLGILVMVSTVLLVAVPVVRQVAFNALAVYTNADARYVSSRGLGLANLVKIPMTLFFFIFGESVYPFNFWLVVPGVAFFGIAGLGGLVQLWRYRQAFWFNVITIITGLGLLYLVFDPLAPSSLQGASPRYLIFLLPFFYLVVAAGVQDKQRWLIVPLLLVNLGSLGVYWDGDWAYTDDLINWRTVAEWSGRYVNPQTLVLTDGRSDGPADYYLPGDWDKRNLWDYISVTTSANITNPRVLVFSSDFHDDRRRDVSRLLENLSQTYTPVAVWNKYPLFVYVFDRKPKQAESFMIDSYGSVDIPREIYGLEFQDLRLPISMSVYGQRIESIGAFALPGIGGQTNRRFVLAKPTQAQRIRLLSNVTGAALSAGTQLGELSIVGTDGALVKYPIRVGMETNVWNKPCQPSTCVVVSTWRKRLALLGSASYAGSWQEFDAFIFASTLELNSSMSIKSLDWHWTSSRGILNVWGIVFD